MYTQVDTNFALIVAAGRGTRMPGDRPKQYRTLGGQAVLRWSAERLLAHPAIAGVRIVYHPEDDALYRTATEGLDLADPVPGGETRQDSVRRGLDALANETPVRVLIHDGARPFVDAAQIDALLAAMAGHDGAIPALPVTDTLKRGDAGAISATVARDGLWRAQTPQGFAFDAIRAAHEHAVGQDFTDDAAVAEAAGLRIALAPGSEENIKITTEEDLWRAERWLAAARETRTGSGFDVHRFGPGDTVRLGGLDIPHSHALAGHSDADAALHAVTDALLGAVGAGDIGMHFPPSDARWRDADSAQFLQHAVELVATHGGRIAHIDITIICEAPKIGPHRDAMVRRMAELLGLPPDRVSVKATTTEGLGFTGRGEGIAVQATATLELPRDILGRSA